MWDMEFEDISRKEQAQAIAELEKRLRKPIPHKKRIDWERFGIIYKNNNIVELCIYDKYLKDLPESFGKLTSLQILDLNQNQLAKLPKSIIQLKSLQKLDLSKNRLKNLPESFGQLPSLQTLNLSSNRLTTLPESFGQLPSLQILNLSSNRLTTLPESFGLLILLKHLDLNNNQLTRLPKSVFQLKSLQILNLSSNQLTFIPESIRYLISLQQLDLSHKATNAIHLPNTKSQINIDGIIEESEWDSAYKITIINESQQFLFIFYLQNDKNYLYIAVDNLFDVTDDNNGGTYDQDHIHLFFDTDNNQALSEGHDNVVEIWGDNTIIHAVVNTSLPNKYMQVADITSFTAKTIFSSSFNSSVPHRTAEFRIALSIFSSMFFGFACIISEATSNQMIPFPSNLLEVTNQSAYINLELREFLNNTLILYLGIGIGISISVGIIITKKILTKN